jgi:hypothetical protein
LSNNFLFFMTPTNKLSNVTMYVTRKEKKKGLL